MHVLVVTHLYSCVEIGDSSFIPFLHDGRLSRGLWLTLWFSSTIRLPSNTKYDPNTCAHVITSLIKVVQGNTVALALSDEPYMQKYRKNRETPIPRTRL